MSVRLAGRVPGPARSEMGIIAISGQPGCRHEEVARVSAQLLGYELVTDSRLRSLLDEEYGGVAIPDKAYTDAVASILARLATQYHFVLATDGAEVLLKGFPGLLRVEVVAPEPRRIGLLMLERRLERRPARDLLRQLERERSATRKARLGHASASPAGFDMVLNSEHLEPEQMAQIVRDTASVRGLTEHGLLSPAAEAHIQFQVRLKLAKHGIVPPAKASLKRAAFMHPSEEIFANLLDFYRIPWEYEPRSFPIQLDKDGRVLEAFTPDFYLPEFDLYVELTTMKQSLVTKKNRKVKLLRSIYPHINIQVFYQKDLENLIFKYGLSERLASNRV